MACEENSRICLHMQLITILSRIGAIFVNFQDRVKKTQDENSFVCLFFIKYAEDFSLQRITD